MLNPWVILGLVLIWGVSLFGVGKWQRHDGATGEALMCSTKENVELVAANAKIKALNDAARAKESEHQQHVADISANFLKERTDREARARKDFDNALTGALRLHVRATCPSPGGSGPGEAEPGTARSDETQVVELPRKTSADLLGLANDADAVADQLRAAQALIAEDRKVCG